jgi:hypothetical protein
MALIALISAKGSPGVTTTALALALTWTSPVILAECDPSGGSVLPGFLRGQLGTDRGLMPLAAAELRSERLATDFWQHLVDSRRSRSRSTSWPAPLRWARLRRAPPRSGPTRPLPDPAG